MKNKKTKTVLAREKLKNNRGGRSGKKGQKEIKNRVKEVRESLKPLEERCRARI